MPAVTLKVDPLLDPGPPKDMMAPPDALFEAETQQQATELAEIDVRVRGPAQNSLEQLVILGHGAILPPGAGGCPVASCDLIPD